MMYKVIISERVEYEYCIEADSEEEARLNILKLTIEGELDHYGGEVVYDCKMEIIPFSQNEEDRG